jgi:hypothetical protein
MYLSVNFYFTRAPWRYPGTPAATTASIALQTSAKQNVNVNCQVR